MTRRKDVTRLLHASFTRYFTHLLYSFYVKRTKTNHIDQLSGKTYILYRHVLVVKEKGG